MAALCGASHFAPAVFLIVLLLYVSLDGTAIQENEHDRGCPPPVDAVNVAKVYRVNLYIMHYIRVAVLF